MTRDYRALASSYDELMADGKYRRRAAFLVRRLKRSSILVETVLDLGCGTGTIACLLAERGYRVLAADGSEDMLVQAAAKAAEWGVEPKPLFFHQSMPRLRLAEPVDAVVSTIDSLNYLTQERELKETFRRVRRWLKPGGLFLFDVNTPYKFQRMDRQVYLDETEDSFCVWRTFFSERTRICTYQVDLFRACPHGRWERDFEEHRERAWSEETLRRCLMESGFSSVWLSGDLTDRPPEAEADRWQFECR